MNQFEELSDYVGMVLRQWSKHVAGPAVAVTSLLLIVLQAFISDPGEVAVLLRIGMWVTIALSFFLIFVAQYDLWASERNNLRSVRATLESDLRSVRNMLESDLRSVRNMLEAETARNARPRIEGEVWGFIQQGTIVSGNSKGVSGVNFGAVCLAYICNTRPAKTSLKAIEFDGGDIVPFLEFTNLIITTPLSVLDHGIGQRLRIEMRVEAPGASIEEVQKIDLNKLRVRVIDGFGAEHPLTVKGEEAFTVF